MRELQPAVYILASRTNGTLYIGVTSQLLQRVYQHRTDMLKGFTSRYQVHRLVWFEAHETMESAILREKQLKKWNRAWKLDLIHQNNPDWEDLYPRLVSDYQGR
jgi:putative endonuclease